MAKRLYLPKTKRGMPDVEMFEEEGEGALRLRLKRNEK